jgi:hypothetical protein
MCINSLYSYPYLNPEKPLLLPIVAYTLSSTKLEIRANSFFWVSRGCGEWEGAGGGGRGWGRGEK